jgi:transposase
VTTTAGRHRLHAAGRQLRHDLLPQDRADLVAVEPVEHATVSCASTERPVELARRLDGVLDRLRRDLVEDHPADRHLGLERLEQVPGDGLALAVLIGREEELVRALSRSLSLATWLFLSGLTT